jgi:hypothetical protein
MTLDSLQSRRKALPFLIAIACILPLLVHSGGLQPVLLRYSLAALAIGLTVPFFYVTLKLREPRWNREQEEHVRAQIRSSLITLIPKDLNVTAEEKNQLESAEIYKTLSGVFWDTINQDELLRAQKEQFYFKWVRVFNCDRCVPSAPLFWDLLPRCLTSIGRLCTVCLGRSACSRSTRCQVVRCSASPAAAP